MRFSSFSIIEFLLSAPCVLLALSVHELCHGWVAYKLGDPTAKNMGRLTLNPLKHLDPIGTICMLIFHFGWARPVPVNSRYFKRGKRDFALVALAGPMSNFIMAFVGLILFHILMLIFSHALPSSDFGRNLWSAGLSMAQLFVSLNLSLGVFNLIPVPPLDGSRIFLVWLPAKYYYGVMKYERYIQIGVMLLLYTGLLSPVLGFLVNGVYNGMDWLVSLVLPIR